MGPARKPAPSALARKKLDPLSQRNRASATKDWVPSERRRRKGAARDPSPGPLSSSARAHGLELQRLRARCGRFLLILPAPSFCLFFYFLALPRDLLLFLDPLLCCLLSVILILEWFFWLEELGEGFSEDLTLFEGA